MFKKIFSLLIILSMTLVLFTGLQISVSAVVVKSGTCGTSLTWSLDDSGVLTISGTGVMSDYGINDNLAPWYGSKDTITKIEIQDGVKTIGIGAFLSCSATSVDIPQSVTSIKGHSFRQMENLESVTIPDGVETISGYTFLGCSRITPIEIPDSVNSIGANAFANTTLDTVYYESGAVVSAGDFPAGVTRVEYSVNEDGKIIIESIKQGDVISEDGKVVIPNKIGGMDVAGVAEEIRHMVSDREHEHKGGTATCSALAVCSICASEYGALDPSYHTYVNGVCTGCNSADPNAGGGSHGTVTPSAPLRPTNPSTPVVTTNAASATETTAAANEIIADDNYKGEDISASSADDSDDWDITDMSMFIIVIAIAAAITAGVLVKKIVF